MAKVNETSENSSSNGISSGDINVIRNILFGQQSAEMNSTLESLNSKISKNDSEYEARFSNMESNFQKKMDTLFTHFEDRIQKLEQHLASVQEQLNQKIDKTSQKDKITIGNLLMEMSKKLTE